MKNSLALFLFGLSISVLSFSIISCKKEEANPPAGQPKVSVKPVVITDSASLITDSSASIHGRLISAGSDSILTAGMEWKKASDPESAYARLNSDSSVFFFNLKNLQPGTLYQTRAFAGSAAGTSYGAVVTFKTDTLPSVINCPATVTDVDGNVYQVVRIGTQCWMKENLICTTLANGNKLKSNLDAALWSTQPVAAYSKYNEDSGNGATYGYLYNQYAILEAGKICPAGWHVPTDADWTTLENYLGGSSIAGGKLKSLSTAPSGLWASPNTGASNSSGFNALPAGKRSSSGEFLELGQKTYWWCSGAQNSVKPRSLSSASESSSLVALPNRTDGYSVRCIAD